MNADKNSAAKIELLDKITNNLKCEECTNYLYNPVKIHTEDNRVICGRCVIKFKDDVLRDDKYITKIGEYLEFPCLHKQYGCKELCTWKEAKRHENACPFRRYKCPSVMTNPKCPWEGANPKCPWEGAPDDMRKHFISSHTSLGTNNTMPVNLIDSSYNYLVENHGELFVFQTKCDMASDVLWYDVRFVGPSQRAPRFHFKVELFIKNEDRKYIERKQVENDDNWELNEAEALCIRIGMVKAMLMNSDDIWLKLEVSVRFPLYNGQADQALMHEVECPVCKDHMIRPIRMCESGHNICNNCFHKLTECPTCRAKFNNTRNISLETLSEQMHYRCMYYDEGCIFTDVPDNIKDHEMVCEVSYYDCPLKQLVNCKWRGRVGHVCIHASKEHELKF